MISIRRFSPGDEKAVRELITGIMNGEFREEKNAYPIDDIDDIPQAYGHLGEAFFVAQDGDKIIGTVAIKKEDDRIALLRRLFVASAYRNQKLGVKLIDRALQFCHEVGYQEIIFKTASRMERAVKICQQRGFVPRASLNLGNIELLKFSYSLRDGVKQGKN